MSHTIEINASEHPVTSVTVYQNRAEVVRRVEVNLEVGQSEVQITKLPTCMDESSLRVDGMGHAVIFDVIYERLSVELNTPKESSEAVQALEKEAAKLRRELKVVESQSTVLSDFSKTLTAKDVNPAQLVNFLELLGDKGGSYEEKHEELETQAEEVQRKIAAIQKGLTHSEEAKKLATKVTVVVLAEQAGKAELTVKYVVWNTSWTPLYDLRATVDSTGKTGSSISLSYRGSITQTTGEDWNDVGLSLSTTSPLTGAQIPELRTERIGMYRPPAPIYASGGFGSVRSRSMAAPGGPIPPPPPAPVMVAAPVTQSLFGQPQQQLQAKMAIPTARAQEGAISATFLIDGLSSIPSDGTTHKVAIGVLDLTAEIEWICVPKRNTSAFLQCQVTNSSSYVLLSGPSNVFLDGSFVAKSQIPFVSPQDTFACSIGVDPAIRITYPPVSKKARTQATGSIFNSSKLDSTVFTQRINVKNTRQTSVKLFVRDQVPVSEDQKLKVVVLEPKELAASKAGEDIQLSKDTVCRWSRKDWDPADSSALVSAGSASGGSAKASGSLFGKVNNGEVPDGQVEWVLNLAPGKGVELVLAWEVAVPQGEKWENR